VSTVVTVASPASSSLLSGAVVQQLHHSSKQDLELQAGSAATCRSVVYEPSRTSVLLDNIHIHWPDSERTACCWQLKIARDWHVLDTARKTRHSIQSH
jgi:hypothetical protein